MKETLHEEHYENQKKSNRSRWIFLNEDQYNEAFDESFELSTNVALKKKIYKDTEEFSKWFTGVIKNKMFDWYNKNKKYLPLRFDKVINDNITESFEERLISKLDKDIEVDRDFFSSLVIKNYFFMDAENFNQDLYERKKAIVRQLCWINTGPIDRKTIEKSINNTFNNNFLYQENPASVLKLLCWSTIQ